MPDQLDDFDDTGSKDFEEVEETDEEVIAFRKHTRKLKFFEEEDLQAVCRQLQMEEVAYLNDEDDLVFKEWGLTKPMQSPEILGIFSSGDLDKPSYFLIIESSLALRSRFTQYIGYYKTSTSYPLTFIYPEGIREKLEDFFTKIDLDFEHAPRFSSKFRVVTEDKNQLQIFLQFKPLEDLAAFPEMEIELRGNYCLFRRGYGAYNEQDFASVVKLMKKIF